MIKKLSVCFIFPWDKKVLTISRTSLLFVAPRPSTTHLQLWISGYLYQETKQRKQTTSGILGMMNALLLLSIFFSQSLGQAAAECLHPSPANCSATDMR